MWGHFYFKGISFLPIRMGNWIAAQEMLISSASAFQLQRKITSYFYNQQEQKRNKMSVKSAFWLSNWEWYMKTKQSYI